MGIYFAFNPPGKPQEGFPDAVANAIRMVNKIGLAALLLFGPVMVAPPAMAQAGKEATPAKQNFPVIPLWPEGAPTLQGADEKEIVQRSSAGDRINSIKNVHRPSIEVHLPPPGKSNGCAVIVAPGGGH